MARVWTTIDADFVDEAPTGDPGQVPADVGGGQQRPPQDHNQNQSTPGEAPASTPLPDATRKWIRVTTDSAMRRYCDRAHKSLYVDKSLDSVFHLDLVRQVYPDLRCILAFRHVMDTIASGVEAQPWGFQAYGYAPYVQASPGNTVAALAHY